MTELMPWEPEIYNKGNLFTSGTYVANKDDSCDECGVELDEGEYIISSFDNAFCSWKCLQRKAVKYPEFYKVVWTIEEKFLP